MPCGILKNHTFIRVARILFGRCINYNVWKQMCVLTQGGVDEGSDYIGMSTDWKIGVWGLVHETGSTQTEKSVPKLNRLGQLLQRQWRCPEVTQTCLFQVELVTSRCCQ